MRQFLLTVVCLLLAACAVPRPTVKIALVAPFEGRLRQVGYDAFPALRLAIRNAIQTGGAGRYNVTFIAYNDNGDPTFAERVAHDVAIDPEVVAVIGHWVPTTTLAAMHVYAEAGLALLAPGIPADALPQDALIFRMGPTDGGRRSEIRGQNCQQFNQLPTPNYFPVCRSDAPPVSELPDAATVLQGFTDITLGTPPAPRSIVAFDATNVIIDAIRLDATDTDSTVTRAGVAQALRNVAHHGLLGEIQFDENNTWAAAPLWEYRQ